MFLCRWTLTEDESYTTFEAWRTNLMTIPFVSRRDVWMQVNYVNIYINNHNTTRQIAAPKPTDFRLLLRNNVTSVRKWYIT